MARFASRELAETGSAGQVLAAARAARRLTIAEVSRALKLPPKHLEAIEANTWYELPVGNYGRYFIRAYAQFLGLDPTPLLVRYGELAQVVVPPSRPRPVVSEQKLDRPLTHPLRRFLLGLAVAGLVLYLALAAWRTFLPPTLTVVSPGADGTTQTSALTVRGLTQPGTRVTINAELIQVSDQGYFSASLALTPGLNTITVVAQKTYSRIVTVRRQVLFTPPALSPGSGAAPMVP